MNKSVFMDRVFKESDYYLTSGYGYRIHPLTGLKSFHYGEDYGTHRLKVPVYSPVYGTVTQSTYNAIRGHYVTIKNPYGLVRLQHLDSRALRVGQSVVPGTKVGICGRSGSSTAVHLHIEYKHLDNTKYDPADFIPKYTDPQPYGGPFPTYTVAMGRGSTKDTLAWQGFLCWYGPDVAKDGKFGKDTYAKTVAFQKANGLVPDGIVGPATRAKAKSIKRWLI